MKRKIFSVLFALVLVLSFSLIPAVPAAAATINVPGDYSTIQAAIDAATDGDTIFVENGTYTEQLAIDGKSLTITGESEIGVIVQAGASPPGSANTFRIGWGGSCTGKNITIQNITIRHGLYGIRSKSGNVNVLHCTLYHNGWDGTGVPAIPTKADMATLWASTHTSNGGAIRLQDSASSEIADCTVYENARGIRYQDGNDGNIHHNVAYDNLESGIYLASSSYTGANGCTNTDVHSNTVHSNMNNGVLVIGGKANSVHDNEIYDNWNSGVMLWHVGEATISNNTINHNNLYSFNGVGNDGDDEGGVWIVGNTIYVGSAFVCKILNNTIDNTQVGGLTEKVGLHVNGDVASAGIEITGNTFTNHDVQVYDPAGNLATPYDMEYVFNNNTFDQAVVVEGSPYHNSIWSSIQDAIDDTSTVSGNTIHVAPGTYNESVTINKDYLTIIGDSMSLPAITGGLKFDTNLTSLTFTNFQVSGNAVAGKNSIVRMYGVITDLAVDNCVFDGENVPGRAGFSGGSLEGTVSVTNSEFKNILGWALFDSRSGSGGDGSAMSTVTFANNYVHDSNGSVVFRGLIADWTDVVNAYGNTWDNINGNGGVTGDAWAALEVNRATEVNIYDNTINDVAVNSWGEGEALQLWGIDTLNVYGNTITNNYMGIWVASLGGTYDVPDGAINFNEIYGNEQYGISLDQNAPNGYPLDAIINWWGDCSGPGGVGTGSGDAVSDNVSYDPWVGQHVYELKTAITGLPGIAFKKIKTASQNKQTLLNKIDVVCQHIDDGAYQNAINKLQRDVKKSIKKWIADPPRSDLINMVDAEIAILENFLE